VICTGSGIAGRVIQMKLSESPPVQQTPRSEIESAVGCRAVGSGPSLIESNSGAAAPGARVAPRPFRRRPACLFSHVLAAVGRIFRSVVKALAAGVLGLIAGVLAIACFVGRWIVNHACRLGVYIGQWFCGVVATVKWIGCVIGSAIQRAASRGTRGAK